MKQDRKRCARSPGCPPQPPELWKEFNEHVNYEVEQLAAVANFVADGRLEAARAEGLEGLEGNALSNALLESLLIHTRALLEFLAKPGKTKRDMAPEDFAEGRWRGPPVALKGLLEKDRLDQEVAHLTYGRKRAGDPAKAWSLDVPIKTLLAMRSFYEAAGRPFPDSAESLLARMQAAAPTPLEVGARGPVEAVLATHTVVDPSDVVVEVRGSLPEAKS